MPYNLVSLGRLTGAGYAYKGKHDQLHILDRNRVIRVGHKRGNLYEISVEARTSHALAVRTKCTWYEWHCALGHINRQQLKDMFTKGMVDGMDVDTSSNLDFTCDACIQAKHSRAPFPEVSPNRAAQVGDLIHSDIWGPARTESLQHNTYYISFTDDMSRFSFLDFLKTRTSALDRFRKLDRLLENQLGRRIKALRVDNAKEYVQGDFKAYLDSHGIILQTTAPYSPAQNGVAKRLNRTVAEHVRAMLIAHNVPRFLWQDGAAYAIFCKNRCPTCALLSKTPYEVFWGRRPDIQDLQEFGIPCWVLVPKNRQDKLSPKSEQYVFTGIADHSSGWRYYSPKTRQILSSRNVVFTRQQEKEILLPDLVIPEAPVPTGEGESPSGADNTGNVPRHSSRASARIDYTRLHNTGEKATKDEECEANLCFAAFNPFDEPRTLQEVMNREDWPLWKEAMEKEMDQLKKTETYEETELPKGRKAIGCRWVFLIKRDAKGQILKYKARLVTQGFSQIPGQDFFQTYAPVMRLESFHTLLTLAAANDWPIHQMNVVGAYLNADLEEEIYMKQVPGFENNTGRVLRLRKGLYGLKQSGRAWNKRVHKLLAEKLGFVCINADFCAYIRVTGDDQFQIILIHVDDMALIAANDELMTFIGLQITRNRVKRLLTIHQERYIQTVLERFHMQDCTPVSTPLDPNVTLSPSPDETEPLDVPYVVAIGSLMYAAVATRPDIAFAVQSLSQFSSRPSQEHWTVVKHVLRYLKGHAALGITYGSTSDLTLTGYSDADWGQSLVDRRSISGFAFMLAGGVITWNLKKQPTVAVSTMEAEYMALAHASREAIWLRALLGGLGFGASSATTIFTDNQAAIALAHDNQFHARSKHIDIRHHFVRECIESNDLAVTHCPSESNAADILTKALPCPAHDNGLKLLSMSHVEGECCREAR
ncbi:hypothetical protein NM688_g7562 [Phlebia brevispora]|uniref:Uncharacterized protein n=1 Tax=Phlebia brevispora TaxID=194682 RepID=A0ACC1S4E3_9APHY|nr:hypothetical protein NM688_g7562 [Phlebia brevispora]